MASFGCFRQLTANNFTHKRKYNTVIKAESLPWPDLQSKLMQQGHLVIPSVLDKQECDDLCALYNQDIYRKKVQMERYRFGVGAYKYFKYPLPEVIQKLRERFYPYLVPVANGWMSSLGKEIRYPPNLGAFLDQCKDKNQKLATPLILKYQSGGYNTLHQDLYGEVYFPIQMVIFLKQPNQDFVGGEFVMTEQIPRAQSRAIVVNPNRGDALFFATTSRPKKGTKGYYRVNMRHGVSEVLEGERLTLGIIFHDAQV